MSRRFGHLGLDPASPRGPEIPSAATRPQRCGNLRVLTTYTTASACHAARESRPSTCPRSTSCGRAARAHSPPPAPRSGPGGDVPPALEMELDGAWLSADPGVVG